LHSYEMFLTQFNNGYVYVSKGHIHKIFQALEEGDDEVVDKLIEEGKAQKYPSSDFTLQLKEDLEHDLEVLKRVKTLWQSIERDPKFLRLYEELSKNPILKGNHIVIFTESKETAMYLGEQLENHLPEKVLLFTGDSDESVRDKVIENFDAQARNKKNDYRILVSTEVLSEGVNLHRANVVINYDIPWNPTRMIQRVGRINRVNTPFDTIHTFNFFPTVQANEQIKLEEAAKAKINAFLTLLGGDAEILTEGEPVQSHELFDRLTSQKTIEGEDDAEESELKYLNVIREIMANNKALFERIKSLPKKARTAKITKTNEDALITYFRKGKGQKFFMAKAKGKPKELDFLSAARLLESKPDEERANLPEHFYDLLEKNKEAFFSATAEERLEAQKMSGRDSATKVMKVLKPTLNNAQSLSDEQKLYLKKVMKQLEEGGLPEKTVKKVRRALENLGEQIKDPIKVLEVLQACIPDALLESHQSEQNPAQSSKREVILSLFLKEG